MLTKEQWKILNSMAAFAEAALPKEIETEDDVREVARIVKEISEKPDSDDETKLFEKLPMLLNLSDAFSPGAIESHIGWADATLLNPTGEVFISILLSDEANRKLESLVEIFEMRAVGFAGIARKPVTKIEETPIVAKAALTVDTPEDSSPLTQEDLERALDITGVKTRTVQVKDLVEGEEFFYEGFLYKVGDRYDAHIEARACHAGGDALCFWDPRVQGDEDDRILLWTAEVMTDVKPIKKIQAKDLSEGDKFVYDGHNYEVRDHDHYALHAFCVDGSLGDITFYDVNVISDDHVHFERAASWYTEVLVHDKEES